MVQELPAAVLAQLAGQAPFSVATVGRPAQTACSQSSRWSTSQQLADVCALLMASQRYTLACGWVYMMQLKMLSKQKPVGLKPAAAATPHSRQGPAAHLVLLCNFQPEL